MRMRTAIGEVLRAERQAQSRTLREVSIASNVSLGYLSEVERGHKEVSSELLEATCQALDLPLAICLHRVANRLTALGQIPHLESVSNKAA